MVNSNKVKPSTNFRSTKQKSKYKKKKKIPSQKDPIRLEKTTRKLKNEELRESQQASHEKTQNPP